MEISLTTIFCSQTGVVPLNAAVDCASAPEWKEQSPLRGSSADVETTCVPRPHNLHITRRVGVDGVVIAWDPLEHDCVAGFQVGLKSLFLFLYVCLSVRRKNEVW